MASIGRIRLVLPLVVVIVAGTCADAQASLPVKPIIENSGMAGVHLGMSRPAVIKHWGQPNDTCRGVPASACSIWQARAGRKTRHGVPTAFGHFAHGALVSIEFLGGTLKTSAGVSLPNPSGPKMGTPFSQLHEIYPSASDLNACNPVGIPMHIAEIGGGSAVTAFLGAGNPGDAESYVQYGITIYNPKKAGLFYDRGKVVTRGRPKNDPACDPLKTQ